MKKMDDLVLAAFADKVLTPERLREMLQEMKRHLKQATSRQDDTLRALKKEPIELETAMNRLYEAVEKGLLPLDACSRSGRKSSRRGVKRCSLRWLEPSA